MDPKFTASFWFTTLSPEIEVLDKIVPDGYDDYGKQNRLYVWYKYSTESTHTDKIQSSNIP